MQEFPRGFVNNNPGNIRHGADGLPGQRIIQTDSKLMQFATPTDGIRAMALLLRGYKTSSIDRLDSVIAQWNRDSPRDVAVYIGRVAAALDRAPGDQLDLDDRATLRALVKAMIRHELGDNYYTDGEIAEGVDRAFDLA
ncbi:MAG: structural protein [Pseudomonadota bacterium]